MSKFRRIAAATMIAAAPVAASVAMAAPAQAGVFVCYSNQPVVNNTNQITGTTVVSAPLPSGVSTSSCPDQSLGV